LCHDDEDQKSQKELLSLSLFDYCIYYYFIGALVALQKFNMESAAQIESNSTFTTSIYVKCVTTTTRCLINQPCHTVRSNSATTARINNKDSANDNDDNNDNGIVTAPFSQGTI
jgi:hypothetical protein